MKGIILAGGKGSRLYPITKGISKQLLPIYDKPMIYYPLSVLMLARIKEIMIIVNEDNLHQFQSLLGDGSDLGINIDYKIQNAPDGLPDAFLLSEEFIGNDSVCLVLGDNIFYGQGFVPRLINGADLEFGAQIFGYYVKDPKEFGVVEFDSTGKVLSIEEKPSNPKSHYVIPGLYFFDNSVVVKTKKLSPSQRGELEMTDLLNEYLKVSTLQVDLLGRGFAWLDTGTYEGLANAGDFVKTMQQRTGLYIACIEEIAFRNNWISLSQLISLGEQFSKTDYGRYILSIADEYSVGG